MSKCCNNRSGSGVADRPGADSFNPNDFERASLEAIEGRNASVVERVSLETNIQGQAIDLELNQVDDGVRAGVCDDIENGGSCCCAVVVKKVSKRGKCKEWWTHEERKVLWECFVRSGGKRADGYIKKVKALWDEIGSSVREVPSLLSQLKSIEKGLLTMMERDEIEKKVRDEVRRVDSLEQEAMEISRAEWNVLFGESDDEREFLGFEGVNVVKCEGGDEGVDEVVIEGGWEGVVKKEIKVSGDVVRDVKVVVEKLVTFRGDDGLRLASQEEKDVFEQMRMVFNNDEWLEIPGLKAQDRRKVNKEVMIVEGLMHNLVKDGMSVSAVNRLLYVGSFVVADRLGLMKKKKGKKYERMNKPRWQRRIEKSIVEWRKDLSRVEELKSGKLLGNIVMNRLIRKYQVVEKGVVAVATLLKGKIKSGSSKIKCYVDSCTKVRQNNLFKNNQRQLYKELGGKANLGPTEAPDAEEATKFWSGIWSVEKNHNADASWLGEVRDRMSGVEKQGEVCISVEDVQFGIRKMANWKAPGPDGVRGFWFKRFRSLHGAIAKCLHGCLTRGEVPDWMVKGRTVLIQKDHAKGTVASNYRPIACLPLMWKLLTGILAEKLYKHLDMNSLLQDEQKGCRKNSRGTKDQLLIDKAVLREARVKKRCLAMGWIDYKKAYDMVPHSWIVEMLEMVKVADNVKRLLCGSMKDWKTVLTSNGEVLGEVGIKRGIFQGDSLSPLLFVLALIPLTMLLNRESIGYKFGMEQRVMNHLLFMDDLKLYGRSEGELERLIEVVEVFSRDIGMHFGLDKCAVLVLKQGMKEHCEGIVLPDGQIMGEMDESGYKYLGVLEGADIMQKEMKQKVRDEYLRRVKRVAKSKLYGGNLIKAINAWAVSVVRYSAGILDWSDRELKEMDVKTRKRLTMFGTFHKKGSVPRLYMKRKHGGRGLISVVDCVRAEELGLFAYVKESREWMLMVVGETLMAGESKKEYTKRVQKERRENFLEKRLHGKFMRDVSEVADERSWQWLRAGYLGKGTEGFVCAAQEQALRTRFFRATIQKEAIDPMCRVCGKEVESVGHLASGCSVLAQKQYKKRHDRMGLRVYWELCRKYGMKCADVWYKEVPDEVRISDDGEVEIWWDRSVETTQRMEHNRPDVTVLNRAARQWTFVDFSVPWDRNVVTKEGEKIEKYSPLAKEIRKLHRVSTKVVPLVVGSLGIVSRNLEGYLKDLGIPDVLGGMQTSAVIGTTLILQKVLSF